MESIVKQDIANLINEWLEQEQKGVQFPVPFDLAWRIAGYSTKQKGQNKLKYLEENSDFLTDRLKTSSGGRPSVSIRMTCDAFKHFCLLAETPEGREIRQYFIEAEKNWRLVQELNPSLAQEIELIKLRNEGLMLEAQKEMAVAQSKQADLALTQFRHTIVNTCPEPVQQKILGYQVIEKTEYRDRIIKDDEILNDGGTVSKTYLCERYGIKTRAGKPDYKALNAFLAQAGIEQEPEAWQLSAYIQETQQLKREYLPHLDRFYQTAKSRQLFLGE